MKNYFWNKHSPLYPVSFFVCSSSTSEREGGKNPDVQYIFIMSSGLNGTNILKWALAAHSKEKKFYECVGMKKERILLQCTF